MIIDAHAHALPGDYPARAGFPVMKPVSGDTAREIVFEAFRMTVRDAFFETERRIEAMDAAGVDEEIVSPMPPLLNYTIDPETARSLHRHVNDSIAQFVEHGGGRIHGIGSVALQDPAAAAEELSYIRDLGLRGVELGSHVNGVALGDVRFVEVFREAERLGLSIFVHTLPRVDEVGLPPALRASIGVGIEATRGAASIAYGGLADICALDHVLFSHSAGGLISTLARADYFWEQASPETRPSERPSEVARRFYYDSMVFDPRGLRFVVDYMGADRIVLGTDFPAMDRPSPLADILEPLALEDRDYANLAFHNARRFLDLPPDRM